MKNSTIVITENDITEAFNTWLEGADADEIARLAGELFGGKCFPAINYDYNKMNYEFTPNENYYGAFGENK